MHFILLLPLILVISVAAGSEVGPGQLDGPEAEQLQLLDSNKSEEELISDDWNSSIESAGSGRRSILCTAAGGKCIKRGDDCEGVYDPKGCKGSRFACCAPAHAPKDRCPVCPIEDGFFIPTGSRQCFKFFPEPGRNQLEAQELCASNGLVLAHPYDVLGLRDYLLQRYGRWAYSWVNGCGDDSEIIWQDNGKILGQDIPLWRPNEPKNLTSDYCLVLATSDINWQKIPDQIYSVYERTDKFQVLCELPLDTTTPPNTNSSMGPCPEGFSPVGSQCFMYVKEFKNWDNARSYCNEKSADIAQPNDLETYRTFIREDPRKYRSNWDKARSYCNEKSAVIAQPSDLETFRTFIREDPPFQQVSFIGIRKEGGVFKWLNGTIATGVTDQNDRDCVTFNANSSGDGGLSSIRCTHVVWFVCETI